MTAAIRLLASCILIAWQHRTHTQLLLVLAILTLAVQAHGALYTAATSSLQGFGVPQVID